MRAALTVAAIVLLCSCGRGSTPVVRPAASTASSASCGAQGFGLSVVPGASGSATPIAAAQDFVRQGGVPGYGSPDSTWQVGASGSDGQVRVSDGHTELYAVRLPDNSWVIARGDKCG